VTPGPHPPARAGSPRRTLTPLLVAAIVLAAGAAAIALTTDGAALRLVGGALFVVAIGFCVTNLLGLAGGDHVETAVLALGLGLATIVVAGLLLDLIEGLDPAGWIGVLAVIVGSTLLVWTRLPARPAPVRADVPATAPARTPWALVAVTGVVCVAAVAIGLAIAVDSAHEQTGAGFTTLALETSTVGDDELGVLVENRERVRSTYRIEARTGDRQLLVADLDLAADEQARYAVPVGELAGGTVVEILLYRDGGADPYRQVSVTLP
jgi:hypothetical protein